MTWLTGIAAYVVIWWVVIFALLPIGAHPAVDEMGERAGAPAHPHLRAKAIATTLISAVLWVILYWIASSDIWSFR